MLVTKNAAELCVLLIKEIYGQLPSRIFAALLYKGRSTTAHLAAHTSLNHRQVRNGLAVLLQQHAIFCHTDQDSGVTHYEANADAAYSLIRSGKILEMVYDKHGVAAKSIIAEVLHCGHVRISDLVHRHQQSSTKRHEGVNGDLNGDANGNMNGDASTNGHGPNGVDIKEDEDIDLTAQAYETIARLLAAGILEPVSNMMFRSPQDLKNAVEQEIIREDFPQGVRGSKQTREFDSMVADRINDVYLERISLKRRLEPEFTAEPGSKRRKLLNGGGVATGGLSEDAMALLQNDPNLAVRVNTDKCEVELRNQKLAAYVEDLVGETTAQVYLALLNAMGPQLNRCRKDPMTQAGEPEEDLFTGPSVTTYDVFEQLSPSLDVSDGIGIPEVGTVDLRAAEKIRRYPPKPKGQVLMSSLHADDEIQGSDDEDYDPSYDNGYENGINGLHDDMDESKHEPNGTKEHFEDASAARAVRMRQMRQHLLVLSESKQGFVRHCGVRDRGEWTVDFDHVLQQMRFLELDTLIEASFGRQGLRLVRILREKGKLDDKTLPNVALMRKADVHIKMAEMEMRGFLDVQEVPRDNNRAANRTIFLWWFDEERTLTRMLEDTYKTITRCLTRLEVERQKKMAVLEAAEREDVKGNEEEMLRGDVYNDYCQFLDIEKKMLAQVARLDDLVAVFRDF